MVRRLAGGVDGRWVHSAWGELDGCRLSTATAAEVTGQTSGASGDGSKEGIGLGCGEMVMMVLRLGDGEEVISWD